MHNARENRELQGRTFVQDHDPIVVAVGDNDLGRGDNGDNGCRPDNVLLRRVELATTPLVHYHHALVPRDHLLVDLVKAPIHRSPPLYRSRTLRVHRQQLLLY
ncbi:hypothetical protein NL676_038237 [Syzygium grande]|nr:hypothetical protein NL676_038237 [Syzygium grande]